jgi:hypothetical protein
VGDFIDENGGVPYVRLRTGALRNEPRRSSQSSIK